MTDGLARTGLLLPVAATYGVALALTALPAAAPVVLAASTVLLPAAVIIRRRRSSRHRHLIAAALVAIGLVAELGITRVHSLPARRAGDMPPVGANTRFLLAQPFLGETARALEDRGAIRLDALFPFGAEGTTNWLHAASQAFGVDEMHFRRVIAPGRERAKRAIAHSAERLNGKRITFLPDSQLEVPLARFLATELG